jgi:hypothetical protein
MLVFNVEFNYKYMIEKPCKFRAKEAKENVLLRF